MTRYFIHISFLFLGLVAFAQENSGQSSSSIKFTSVNASGGDATSSAGSMSYSIGNMYYTNMESSDNLISQSVQQSVELEAKINQESTLVHVYAYPNPTTNYVILDIVDFKKEVAQYQIFSPTGSILKTGFITSRATKLILEYFSNATYFIRVSVLNKFDETVQVIKQ